MQTLKFSARAAIVILAILAASIQAARAETIYLECTGHGEKHLTIDLAHGTVNNHPAQIDHTSIDWQVSTAGNGVTADIHYHLDRTTGTETSYAIYHVPNSPDSRSAQDDTDSCTKVSAPATKF